MKVKIEWSESKALQFLNWYIASFSNLKHLHEIDDKFLLYLWQESLKDNKICYFFLTELYKADANNIKFIIKSTKQIVLSENVKCVGYFDSAASPAVLASTVGYGDESHWLSILVHETCHMDQYLEDPILWKEYDRCIDIDDWLSGKRESKFDVEHAIDKTQKLELDCERRAVRKLKKFNLPIDTDEYIQKANSYVFFHQYLKTSRTWPVPGKLYNKRLYSKLPTTFLNDDAYTTLPDEYRVLFDKYL